MRLLAPLFIVTLLLPGCLMECDIYSRRAFWMQDAVPAYPSHSVSDERRGDLWGGISKDPDTGELHLHLYANRPISHEDLVEFANWLFAKNGWPPPDFQGVKEYHDCDDVI